MLERSLYRKYNSLEYINIADTEEGFSMGNNTLVELNHISKTFASVIGYKERR